MLLHLAIDNRLPSMLNCHPKLASGVHIPFTSSGHETLFVQFLLYSLTVSITKLVLQWSLRCLV